MGEFTIQELETIVSVCKLRLQGIRGYHLNEEEEVLNNIINKINKKLQW